MKFNFDNKAALIRACMALNLPVKENSVGKMYGRNSVTGTVIQLPGWAYPIVVTEDGKLQYDPYNSEPNSYDRIHEFTAQYNYEVATDALEENEFMYTETEEGDEIVLLAYQM